MNNIIWREGVKVEKESVKEDHVCVANPTHWEGTTGLSLQLSGVGLFGDIGALHWVQLCHDLGFLQVPSQTRME